MDKARLDKWLWSVRIFKSRSLATKYCKNGKVKLGDKILKPSAAIDIGNIFEVRKNGFVFQFRVDKILQKRVGAQIAVNCYTDLTPESELNKYKDWFIGKAAPERRDKGAGRPTKRERRVIDDFKNFYFDDDEF